MEGKTTAFSDRMAMILNYGALNLAMALGYRNRIFDVLDDLESPVTADELARLSGLDERYLREWLGVMVTGDIVEISSTPEGKTTYFLPPEHAALLTRRAGAANLGVYTQEIPLLTSCAMEPVHKAFRTGEGVPFSRYPDFQAFMTELSNAKHRQVLIDRFLPSVDEGRLVERLARGIRVCDLGCGEGVALNLMARAFPESECVGVDNHPKAIETARAGARELRLSNVEYRILDAARIGETPELEHRFDYVFAFDAIHDQPRPLKALQGVRHMLAPGGLFSMIEIDARSDHESNRDHPMGPFLYTVSLMHCMPVGLIDQGTGLGMMWGRERADRMLRDAGFDSIEFLEMEQDPFNLHYLCRA